MNRGVVGDMHWRVIEVHPLWQSSSMRERIPVSDLRPVPLHLLPGICSSRSPDGLGRFERCNCIKRISWTKCRVSQTYAYYCLSCVPHQPILLLLHTFEACAGSLFEEIKRRHMPKFILTHLAVSIVTVGINVWGTVLLYHLGTVCDGQLDQWTPSHTFRVLVWMTWAILILFFFALVLPLNAAPGSDAGYSSWHRRWTIIAMVCCCRRRVPLPRSALPSPLAAQVLHFKAQPVTVQFVQALLSRQLTGLPLTTHVCHLQAADVGARGRAEALGAAVSAVSPILPPRRLHVKRRGGHAVFGKRAEAHPAAQRHTCAA